VDQRARGLRNRCRREGRSVRSARGDGVGLTAGTGLGILTADVVSPSIGRVRLIDLSVLGGAALYAGAANRDPNGHALSGATALGISAGLAIGWFATSRMERDRLRSVEPASKEPAQSSKRNDNPSTRGPLSSIAENARPMLMPGATGTMIGVGGSF
jgi:hypothetical protein